MQYRLQQGLVPMSLAHLMGRTTETNDEGTIRFRVQADRRRVQTLAKGAADRRVRRTAANKDEGVEAVNGSASPALARTPQND